MSTRVQRECGGASIEVSKKKKKKIIFGSAPMREEEAAGFVYDPSTRHLSVLNSFYDVNQIFHLRDSMFL